MASPVGLRLAQSSAGKSETEGHVVPNDEAGCEVCGQPTHEGKPFCVEHVEQHPYVSHLLVELAAQAAERAQVARQGPAAVDLDGTTARELMRLLFLYGPRTLQGLGRELQIPPSLVSTYARALAEAGRVSLGKSRRGKTVVTPVTPVSARRLGGGRVSA
jgi:hypothetical protein